MYSKGLDDSDYVCDNAVMKIKISLVLFFRISDFHQLCELSLGCFLVFLVAVKGYCVLQVPYKKLFFRIHCLKNCLLAVFLFKLLSAQKLVNTEISCITDKKHFLIDTLSSAYVTLVL